MANYTYALSGGQYIHSLYTVTDSVAGTWTSLGNQSIDAPITIQAVEWSTPTLPANLALRDSTGQVFFTAASGSSQLRLTTPVTIKAPCEYLDSRGGNRIVLLGKFG